MNNNYYLWVIVYHVIVVSSLFLSNFQIKRTSCTNNYLPNSFHTRYGSIVAVPNNYKISNNNTNNDNNSTEILKFVVIGGKQWKTVPAQYESFDTIWELTLSRNISSKFDDLLLYKY